MWALCLQVTYLTVFMDLSKIAFFGGAIAWFARITEPERFAWLFSRQVLLLEMGRLANDMSACGILLYGWWVGKSQVW